MDLEKTAQHFDLSGKVILVTGGTRGLGLAMARAFAEAGASLVVSSRKAEACSRGRPGYQGGAGSRVYRGALSRCRLGRLRRPGRGRLCGVRQGGRAG